ncbi:MAG: hypothetical protein RLZZ387_437 [Chloroflexota bacterium]
MNDTDPVSFVILLVIYCLAGAEWALFLRGDQRWKQYAAAAIALVVVGLAIAATHEPIW